MHRRLIRISIYKLVSEKLSYRTRKSSSPDCLELTSVATEIVLNVDWNQVIRLAVVSVKNKVSQKLHKQPASAFIDVEVPLQLRSAVEVDQILNRIVGHISVKVKD